MAVARPLNAFENFLVDVALGRNHDELDEKHLDNADDRQIQEQDWAAPATVFDVKITGNPDDIKTIGFLWNAQVEEQKRLLDAFDPEAIARAAEQSETLALALQYGDAAVTSAIDPMVEQARLEELARLAEEDAKFAASLQ